MSDSNKTEPATVELFQLYYTPLLVLSGVIGNCLSIFVFCQTKLRKLSSSYYLTALAVSDNVFLVALFIVWLKLLDLDLFNRQGVCQIIVYITGVCSFLSVWLVTAFTSERFVAVKYPFLRQTLCTTERAKMGITMLSLSAFAMFSPLLVFSTVVENDNSSICTIDSKWSISANVFNYIDSLITYVIPVTIIVSLNISISRTILNLASVRKLLTNQNTSFRYKHKRAKGFRNRISQDKITKMLLIVSTVFLCLNFPSYEMRLMTYLNELNIIQIENVELFQTAQHWCLQLFYTNFGINFYLYCVSGQNFRKALYGLIRFRRLKRTETVALTESRTLSSGSSVASRKKKSQSIFVENPETRSSKRHPSSM